MSTTFNDLVIETYQNIPYYLNVVDNIIKSQYFQAENKQQVFVFFGTTGKKVYGNGDLLGFFYNGVLGVPVSYYTDPVDQEIYTIWITRDFFQNLLDAAAYSISYHNEGKFFSYIVTFPSFLYHSSAQRSQQYNGDQLSALWYTAVLAGFVQN
jgi:hypothetical protein